MGPPNIGNGRRRALRIAMLAPPWFEIPPRAYGGIEWVVHWLVEGLMERGHDIFLVAAGDYSGSARFVQSYRAPPSARVGQTMPELVNAAAAAHGLTDLDLDIVHDHSLAGPLLSFGRSIPTIVTAHGSVSGEYWRYYSHLRESISLVAISDAQRRSAPTLPWAARVHNAVPVNEYPFREEKDDYALFLGRIGPEKGAHLAVEAARRAGIRLVIAAKCTQPEERAYFEEHVSPRLGPDDEWRGEVDTRTKKDLLSRARCLLFPVQWEEPFGMVMVEAMACGTPVVALKHGSVSEVVKHGATGYICDDPAQLSAAIGACDDIDPSACRTWVAQQFDTATMVSGYERVYRLAIADRSTAPPGSHSSVFPLVRLEP
jgi:glycosyltransferase involved in cell wall biosynthesis